MNQYAGRVCAITLQQVQDILYNCGAGKLRMFADAVVKLDQDIELVE